MELLDKVVKVSDNVYGKVVEVYLNGYETTAGFVNKDDVKEVISITYDSKHTTELPVDWRYRYFLDDNGKLQMIKDVYWGEAPAYLMEDGSKSLTVTF